MFIVIQAIFLLDRTLVQPIMLISASFSAAVYAILSSIAIVLFDVARHGN